MAVCFSNENIHVQFIDDDAGETLAAASTVGKTAPKDAAANVKGAKTIGTLAAKNALDKGIKEVVFDRGGNAFSRQGQGAGGRGAGSGIKILT